MLQSDTSVIPIQTAAELAEALSPTENWTGVGSSAKRKKLQNRLNQRARRRRRQEHSQPPTGAVGPFPLPSIDNGAYQKNHPSSSTWIFHSNSNGRQSTVTACLLGRAETRKLLLLAAQSSYDRYRIGTPSLSDLNTVVRFNIFHAFGQIAQTLGFNNDWLRDEAISPFCTPDQQALALLPTTRPHFMNPTSRQFKVEHHPWIDFFPCPQLRDNLLAALLPGGELLDEDDLCRDVVDGGAGAGIDSAGVIVWGTPWEPSGWEVTESFVKKWGWLLAGCVELKTATNYWRRKRGLKGIEFAV